MDYNKLNTFLEVVKRGGVTEAAKVLFRTQSALSQQLSNLERELGVSLFDRVGKSLVLSRQGKDIYEAINKPLNEIKDSINWVLNRGEQSSGEIKIGVLHDHSTRFSFFKKLAAFQKKYPLITAKIQFDTSNGIENALLNNELDVGFLIIFKSKEFFTRNIVAQEEHILVGSKSYAGIKNVDDLLTSDLVDIDKEFTCLSTWIRKNARGKIGALRRSKPKLVAPNHLAILEVVQEGYGVALLPNYLIKEKLKTKKLIRILPKFSSLTVELDIARRTSHKMTLYERLFFDYFRNARAFSLL